MVLGFRKNGIKILPLKINDQIMKKVSTYKYVGVTIEWEAPLEQSHELNWV